jgi:hypothetical protein
MPVASDLGPREMIRHHGRQLDALVMTTSNFDRWPDVVGDDSGVGMKSGEIRANNTHTNLHF